MTSPKYAETWLDVGRLPLRRRDRASLVLAYEMCRRRFPGYTRDEACNVRVHAAMTVLGMGEVTHAVWNVLGGSRVSESRIVLARLALLLRTILRVDAGDYGPWLWWPEEMIADSTCGEYGGVRPLWQSARRAGR